MNLILRKCKSLSRQLGRSSSYSSLRSKSSIPEMGSSDHHHNHDHVKNKNKNDDDVLEDNQELICILVGSTRKRYLISSKHLRHPLVSALVEKPGEAAAASNNNNNNNFLVVKCEVVFFDHLLWMLDNADPINLGLDSLEELAHLYML